jgi:hypothetical protein
MNSIVLQYYSYTSSHIFSYNMKNNITATENALYRGPITYSYSSYNIRQIKGLWLTLWPA